MVITAQQARGLAQRLAKAEALVAAGSVHPVAGMDGLFAVTASDGASVHLVDTRPGRERCSCPDFQQRQQSVGMSCKHQLACDLCRERQQSPTLAPAAVDSARGIAALRRQRDQRQQLERRLSEAAA